MQTDFTLAQLADPDVRESEKILRACVHCGFCTATCPTYVLLGDELDSPRGRIYLIKDMLESGRAADRRVVTHIDRCLSCLSCMSTCPSGVHYMHLVDHARKHIQESYRRPAADRWLRRLLAWLLPHPGRFRLALVAARLAKPFAGLVPEGLLQGRARAMLSLAPGSIPPPSPADRPQTFPAEGPRRYRMALMTGCAQQVLAPEINEATIRLLTRHGVEVVVARGMGCCGALTHHMGEEAPALASARRNVEAWTRELDRGGLDAIVINASGCGTTVKDYGFMLREDTRWADRAQRISGLAKDVSEVMSEIGLKPALPGRGGLTLAYHSACSLQHGQQVKEPPKALLRQAGFEVREVAEGHLCCGSAGTYNLLQPAIAGRLRDRKVANLEASGAEAIATGNIGCMTQIAGGTDLPILHSVAFLDWATGGPLPKGLEPLLSKREAEGHQEAVA